MAGRVSILDSITAPPSASLDALRQHAWQLKAGECPCVILVKTLSLRLRTIVETAFQHLHACRLQAPCALAHKRPQAQAEWPAALALPAEGPSIAALIQTCGLAAAQPCSCACDARARLLDWNHQAC